MYSAEARYERAQEWDHVSVCGAERDSSQVNLPAADRQEVNEWLKTRFSLTRRSVPPRREQVGQARLAALLPWWGSVCLGVCMRLCVGVKQSISRREATKLRYLISDVPSLWKKRCHLLDFLYTFIIVCSSSIDKNSCQDNLSGSLRLLCFSFVRVLNLSFFQCVGR